MTSGCYPEVHSCRASRRDEFDAGYTGVRKGLWKGWGIRRIFGAEGKNGKGRNMTRSIQRGGGWVPLVDEPVQETAGTV
jgi:hypothetical protein